MNHGLNMSPIDRDMTSGIHLIVRSCVKMGWSPRYSFEEGLKDTVEWYIRNEWWWRPLQK